jgi:hypothetical protein
MPSESGYCITLRGQILRGISAGMNKDTDSQILKALITFDGVLGLMEIFVSIMGAILILTGVGTLLVGMQGSASSTSAGLASMGGLVVMVIKGGVLLYTLAQLSQFRQAMRRIWQQRDEFFVEKSLSEDKGLWVYAGLKGLIVVFLLAFCTGI